jgi:hypothetical protein
MKFKINSTHLFSRGVNDVQVPLKVRNLKNIIVKKIQIPKWPSKKIQFPVSRKKIVLSHLRTKLNPK